MLIQLFDSQENRQNCCHQRSDFKAKMHQNSISAGLHPRPPSWILGTLLLREEDGGGREGREEEGVKGKRGDPPRVG